IVDERLGLLARLSGTTSFLIHQTTSLHQRARPGDFFASAARVLQNQKQLAGRAPRREEAQRCGRFGERKPPADRDGELALARETEDGLEAAAVGLAHAVDHRYDEPA